MRFDRTYSLHQTAPWMEPVERRRKPKPSYGYGCGREHVQNASALRDFVHGCNYASKTGVERGHFAKAYAPAHAPYLRPVGNSCNMRSSQGAKIENYREWSMFIQAKLY